MSFCPKCGNNVEETMVFCPRCGASLKAASSGPPTPPPPARPYRRDEKSEKNEKREKQEKNERSQRGEKAEKQEKGETGFIGYLIGGLILITLGLFSVLQISGYFTVNSGQSWAVMLLVIGIIIIVGAVYVAMVARKRSPQPT